MSITITLTDSELDVLQMMIKHISANEYPSFIDGTREELDIDFNTADNDRIEQALNDDDYYHPYLWSVIMQRALDNQ